MKVLLVLHHFLPEFPSGVEVYAYHLAQELKKRHEVVLFFSTESPATSPDYTIQDGIFDGLVFRSVVNRGQGMRNFVETYQNPHMSAIFQEFLDMTRPDVVHVHHLLTLSIDILSQLKARAIPIVFTLHDFWLQCPLFTRLKSDSSLCWAVELDECARCAREEVDRLEIGRWRRAIKWSGRKHSYYLLQLQARERAMKAALENVSLFLGPSRFLLEEFHKWGLPVEKSRYSPYGYRVADKEASVFRQITGKMRFGFIGSIVYHKGLHVLLEAFRDLNHSQAELHIFGGFYDHNYQKRVLALAKDDQRIVFHGRFLPESLSDAYAYFDVLVVPSIWFENSPLTINEAFINQTPVIVGDVGGMRELVTDNEFGRLFTVGDSQSLGKKMKEVVENPGLVEQWRKNLPRVKTIEENATELEEIYSSFLLGQAPGELEGQEGGRRDSLVGSGDFKKIGEDFLRYFIELGDLKPNERVLDVGCGIGRMAIPLTEYLDKRGSYEGFDIVAKGIDWCKKEISPKYPNFRFQLADVFNKNYRPQGQYKASGYRFPYENESFDLVFLVSVFTHMLPPDMNNYFSEIARVLKPGGRCLITFFLLNEESLKLIEAKSGSMDFTYEVEEYRIVNQNTPESAVAYNEAFIRGLYKEYGLNVVEPLGYGAWCGRQDFLHYQDIIIARKK